MSITGDLGSRLHNALDQAEAVEPGIKNEFLAIARAAHTEATAVLDGNAEHSALAHVAGAWAALADNVDGLEHHAALEADRVAGRLPVHVSADGTLWGIGTYLQLDPGWTEALIHYLENRNHKASFVTKPVNIEIPDTTTVAVVGDWGTGYWRPGTGAQAVATVVAAGRPDYTVHLGDVYYAGSSDEERSKFVDLWPRGTRGSLTLNSNHEMYDGAKAYFAALAPSGPFAMQGGCSYVTLRNSDWLIIGLDTAFYSTGNMYLDGAIDPGQIAFLRECAASAGSRAVIVVSHHEGLNLPGTATTALWQQVVSGLGQPPTAWYWGHAHNGIVYATTDGCRSRCVGHGAIPYGPASMFNGSKTALWCETALAGDVDVPKRVKNGFARLTFRGRELLEEIVAEDGSIRWSSTITPAAAP
jgi:hypothetical protein